MKNLNDLKLCKKSRKIVEDWLTEWLDMFIRQANGMTGWPYRADFEKDDFFYFTNCKDILSKDPEAKGQENNIVIVKRKQKVRLILLMKTLLGRKNICDVITCGHCGYKPCWIDSLGDGNGHWVYCPKCYKTDIHVFPDGYDNCVKIIRRKVAEKRFPIPSRGERFPIKIKPDPRLKDVIIEEAVKKGRKWRDRNKSIRGSICDKCGSKGPFDYATGLCNDCYMDSE